MQRINEDIKNGVFSQIYLLYGEEGYLKRQYTEKLKKALCAEGDEMNVHTYKGKDLPVGEIIDLAETLPFLAERRVIFINGSGLFKENGEKMADYLEHCSESTFFVFTEDDVDKRSRLYKLIQKKGHAAEFTVQDEKTLKRWIAGLLGKEGKKISESTAQFFLARVGTDMENIRTELEKLICYCMDTDVITDRAIEEICTERITNHIFDMVDAIAAKDQQKALRLYYDLIALKEAPMRILILIARQCNLLLQVKGMKSRGYDSASIAQAAGIPKFFVGKYVSQAAKFSAEQLKAAVTRCVEAETSVKKGILNDTLSVELLIFTVL